MTLFFTLSPAGPPPHHPAAAYLQAVLHFFISVRAGLRQERWKCFLQLQQSSRQTPFTPSSSSSWFEQASHTLHSSQCQLLPFSSRRDSVTARLLCPGPIAQLSCSPAPQLLQLVSGSPSSSDPFPSASWHTTHMFPSAERYKKKNRNTRSL